MALRVKNIAQGFYDASGFHPIRSSPDYDPTRLDEPERGRYGTAPKRRKKGKGYGSHKKWAAPKSRAKSRRKTKAKRKKNPIPTKWTTAKVKRTSSGDVQVMLTKSAVRKRSRRRR